MLENILLGFQMVASFENIFALFAGTLGGVIIGALPGLTGVMAVTLALPFTFYMSPITSLMLLLGIYKGAMYGGSISAILIRTPGTAAAACTAIDGYALTQQGKAGKALNIALFSSCFADFVSNISLIFFAGVIANFALRFGPAEFFSLICFSLTIVAGLSGGEIAKGAISACLGLLAATVGMDVVFGTGRFTMNDVNLMAGLGFIPVLIGLFALPEIIKAAQNKSKQEAVTSNVDSSIKDSLKDFKRCFKSILRGSFIGIIFGAIPGIGGAPAAYFSYSEAKRTSKTPETFGKGEVEGVAAAEAGNNGVCGSTLIPLLSLGIPGDVVTAVMLGAFMMNNITPGPLLFIEHAPLVHGLYIGILLSSLFLFISGIVCIRSVSQITKAPKAILFPAILIVCLFGAFSINNNTFDLLVVIIMGIVGVYMVRHYMVEAPFLVAFVLGPLFENNLRRSLLISNGDISIFWSTPICWFFIALTLLSIIFTIKKELQQRNLNKQS